MTDLSGISSKTRRWPKRPLGRQALLGVVGLLSLFVAFAVLAIALVARSNGDEKHLDTASVDYVNAVQQGALDAKGIANDQRGFLLSGEEQFLVEAEGRISSARAALARAEDEARTTGERDTIADATTGFEQFITAVRAEIDQFRRGDRQGAIDRSLTTDRDLRKTYEASLERAQQVGMSRVTAGRDAANKAAVQTIRLLVAGLVVALVIGVLIGLWLLRSIARPLFRLVEQLLP